jgi:hypothetical protein
MRYDVALSEGVMKGGTNRRIAVGDRFGRLVVVEVLGWDKGRYRDRFRCDCGNEVILSRYSVMQGKSKSCGCLRREAMSRTGLARRRYGGGCRHPLYQAWVNLVRRASTINSVDYERVCRRWLFDYLAFRNDLEGLVLGDGELGLLDRSGYWEPGNVGVFPKGEARRRRWDSA